MKHGFEWQAVPILFCFAEYDRGGRLRDPGLFRLEKTKKGFHHAYKYLMDGSKVDGAKFFSVVPRNKTRGNGYKLEHKKFHLNTRKHFCAGAGALAQATQRGCGVSSQRPSEAAWSRGCCWSMLHLKMFMYTIE